MENIKLDNSEYSTFNHCQREWALSSRNMYHLAPVHTAKSLEIGTLFHEALARAYLSEKVKSEGGEAPYRLDEIMDWIKMEAPEEIALQSMVKGYLLNKLPEDMEHFSILEVEFRFNYPFIATEEEQAGPSLTLDFVAPERTDTLNLVGAIDLIVFDQDTESVWGLEHKTCAQWRSDVYNWLDSQPRVYYWALQRYCREHNLPFGGLILNETRKLIRTFENKRTVCAYSENELEHFMELFRAGSEKIMAKVVDRSYVAPSPNYFSCQMCDYAAICNKYGYGDLPSEEVLHKFIEEEMLPIEKRELDHLDSRSTKQTGTQI